MQQKCTGIFIGKVHYYRHKFADRIERIFVSYLVDVTYIEEMNDDFIVAAPDDYDNKNEEYLFLAKQMIEETISKHCEEVIQVEMF